MTNTILVLILVANVSLLVYLACMTYQVRSIWREVITFITPASEKEPSPLGNFIQATAEILSRTLVMQAKATFMGKSSGDVRAEGAVADAVQADLASAQSPILGAILDRFPRLNRTLRRNPGLADIALQFLASKLGGGVPASAPSPGGGSNGHDEQVKFKL